MTNERVALYTYGPRFFREGDEVMFEFWVDASTRQGPRPMTENDQRAYPDAWAKFEAGETEIDRVPAVRGSGEPVLDPALMPHPDDRDDRGRFKPGAKGARK